MILGNPLHRSLIDQTDVALLSVLLCISILLFYSFVWDLIFGVLIHMLATWPA